MLDPDNSRAAPEGTAPRSTQALTAASILSDEGTERRALEVARRLIGQGARIFAASPVLDAYGNWDPLGGVGGYRLPKHWEQTVASLNWLDPTVRGFEVKAWRPGWALCMVTGGPFDVVDSDPRNGSDASREQLDAVLPTVYAQVRTPSGGTHEFVAPLGVGSRDGFLPGIDLKGGKPDGSSRGFIFLAPTRKISKATGAVASYKWITAPGGVPVDDQGGASLAALVRPSARTTPPPRSAVAPAVLDDAEAQRLATWTAAAVEGVQRDLQEAHAWPDGYTDDRGRGWQKISADAALRLGSLARADWCRLTLDQSERLFLEAAPSAPTYDLGTIWRAQSVRGEVAPYPAERVDLADEVASWATTPGVRVDPALLPAARDHRRAARPALDVTNHALAAQGMCERVGTGPLSRFFRRDGALVDVPLIGEDGYQAPEHGADGPGQVHRADANRLRAVVQHAYAPYVERKEGERSPALFPRSAAEIVLASADMLPHVRPLKSVIHTPLVRPDGSLLDEPGWDAATGALYLPQPGLIVPPVPSVPTRAQVDAAAALLLQMVADFAFLTPHDRANYLGMQLTPLLREMVPPPYKLGVINAPQPGAGKTLLAQTVTGVHGGVFRAEVPADEAEMSKTITALLDGTTAPVVHLDNASGVIRSSTLAGLLTSDEWSQRRLGSGDMVTARNDRLWLMTGNNVALGGDLVRRALTVTIDPGVPNPHLRQGFAIPDLASWVRRNRGEILHALLTLVRGWVSAGRPTRGARGSDSYAAWVEAVDGILAFAGIDGTFDHAETAQQEVGADDDEWRDLLAAVYRALGDDTWTAKELLARVDTFGGDPTKPIPLDALPAELAEKVARSATGGSKSLGMWLRNRAGRWAGHYVVKQVGRDRTAVALWRVEVYVPRDLAGSAGSAGSVSNPYAGEIASSTSSTEIARAGGLPKVPADPADPAEDDWQPFATGAA